MVWSYNIRNFWDITVNISVLKRDTHLIYFIICFIKHREFVYKLFYFHVSNIFFNLAQKLPFRVVSDEISSFMTITITAKIIRVVLKYVFPLIVVCDHIRLKYSCLISTGTWVSPNLLSGFPWIQILIFKAWTQVDTLWAQTSCFEVVKPHCEY